MSLFEPVLTALASAGVRYVVVGGVATVLHGHVRLTADLDLAIDLSPDQARRAIDALTGIGLAPVLPVAAVDFADPVIRCQWVEEPNLKVFSLYDPGEPLREVDLFAEDPLPFDELRERAVTVPVGSIDVRVVAIDDLLVMKRPRGVLRISSTSKPSRRSPVWARSADGRGAIRGRTNGTAAGTLIARHSCGPGSGPRRNRRWPGWHK